MNTPRPADSTAAISSFFIAFPLASSGMSLETGNTLWADRVPNSPGQGNPIARASRVQTPAGALPYSPGRRAQRYAAPARAPAKTGHLNMAASLSE